MYRSRFSCETLLALAVLGTAAPVAAQEGFAIDRFSPAERGSDWQANDGLDLRGRLRPAAGLVLDFAHNPLVAYGSDGKVARSIIERQFFAHLGGALILANRIRFGVNMPLLLQSTGDPVVTPQGQFETETGFALGDPRLTFDLRLVGLYDSPFTLAGGAEVYVPAGTQDAFASDGTLRVIPRLLAAGNLGVFAYAGRVGVHVRPAGGEFAGTELGSELGFGAALGVRLIDRSLLVGPELTGSTLLGGGDGATPIEALLGGKYTIARDYRVGIGIGPGLTRGFGSPDLRVLASFEWFPTVEDARDRDGDGIVDGEDRCPARPAGRTPDPARPGCPARDADGDGIVDLEDACPTVAGVRTTNSATNGCPPPPPPPSPPPPDRDGDGVPDPQDACPDEVGVPQQTPATNGCPRARLETQAMQIRILQRIEFEYKSADLTASSTPVLEDVRVILAEHPELAKVEIQGHTDDVGPDDYNVRLSVSRAEAVRLWLVSHGIEGSRLTAVGFGKQRPLDTNDTYEGRQLNRRVEFHIVEDTSATDSTTPAVSPSEAAPPGSEVPDSAPAPGAPLPPYPTPGDASSR
ncbi:MAG: OmpA family protein [Polyangiaceae bacterium]|nr:OmpA family protein [Polyangiaceae bacterium]